MCAKYPFPPPLTPLEELIAQAYQAMVANGSGYHTVYETCRYWRRIMEYATQHAVSTFSSTFAEEYLAMVQQQPAVPASHVPSIKHALQVLGEVQQHGHWDPRPLPRRVASSSPFSAPSTPLETLIAQVYQQMVSQGYRAATLAQEAGRWQRFITFADAQGIDILSPSLATTYVTLCREDPMMTRSQLKGIKRALRRLLEFAECGTWQRFPARSQETSLNSTTFTAARERFLQYWQIERQVARNTYQYGRRYTLQFLQYLEAAHIKDWSPLSASIIGCFVSDNPNWSPGTRQVVISTLRSFFRYLFIHGEVGRDWSCCLPTVHRGPKRKLPVIWTAEELTALFAAVERTSAVGKRDYAILLLACRLGMRASDIRTLCLEDIHWEHTRLDFTQEKTGRHVVLPLPTEVGEAVIAYLREGRPQSHHREVFLCHTAPFAPFGHENRLHRILNDYRERAGIYWKPGQAHGMHSLRHTFATHMQAATVPLETIASLLGHQCLESTRIYTQIDLTALRQVALDPEEVTYDR